MRRTPLRRKVRLQARRPMRRTRRKPTDTPAYLARVRSLPCAAPLSVDFACSGPMVAHHPRHLAPGVGRRAPDRCAIPLCDGHHKALHGLTGPFRGWKREQLRAWQDAIVSAVQRHLGLKGGEDPSHFTCPRCEAGAFLVAEPRPGAIPDPTFPDGPCLLCNGSGLVTSHIDAQGRVLLDAAPAEEVQP